MLEELLRIVGLVLCCRRVKSSTHFYRPYRPQPTAAQELQALTVCLRLFHPHAPMPLPSTITNSCFYPPHLHTRSPQPSVRDKTQQCHCCVRVNLSLSLIDIEVGYSAEVEACGGGRCSAYAESAGEHALACAGSFFGCDLGANQFWSC